MIPRFVLECLTKQNMRDPDIVLYVFMLLRLPYCEARSVDAMKPNHAFCLVRIVAGDERGRDIGLQILAPCPQDSRCISF